MFLKSEMGVQLRLRLCQVCLRRKSNSLLFAIKRWRAALLTILFFLPCATLVLADTVQRFEYSYDAGGNLIGVRSYTNVNPPDVTNLSPGYINRENTATVIATGTDLFGAAVSPNNSDLIILRYESISAEALSFTITANSDAAFGPSDLSFTTTLGSDVEPIVVAGRIPIISTNPNPIVLRKGGVAREVSLEFDRPFPQDQTYQLDITDETLAVIDESSVTLVAGQTQVTVTLSGLESGNTQLRITQLENFLALGIPVVVSDTGLPEGVHSAYSRAVGVAVYTDQPVESTTQFAAEPVGVAVYTDETIETTTQFTSASVGVATGPLITSNAPIDVVQGGSTIVSFQGVNLNQIESVSLYPDTGISQTQAFAVNAEGSELQLYLDVAVTAAVGERLVLISTSVSEPVVEVSSIRIVEP